MMRLLGVEPSSAIRATRVTVASSIPRSVARNSLGRLSLSGESAHIDAARSERRITNLTSKSAECAIPPRQILARRNTHVTRNASFRVTSTQESTIMDELEQHLGTPLSSEPTVPPPKPHVFLISGASGVGKDAVIQRLQQLRPDLHFVVCTRTAVRFPADSNTFSNCLKDWNWILISLGLRAGNLDVPSNAARRGGREGLLLCVQRGVRKGTSLSSKW
eukprot:1175825-Prorocentrum_minimum.AAC.4